MKIIRNVFAALMITTITSFGVSCSNGDSDESESNKLESTSWSSVETLSHDSLSIAKDKTESNTTILSKMEQMVGLKYTEGTSTETTDASWNLCKRAEHECDSTMSLTFTANKCNIKVSTSKTYVKAKVTKTYKEYKFEEGSYIVRVGPSAYEGINVYSYGIYRADGTLYIPLDGKEGKVAIETEYKYTDKKTYFENLEETTISADYKISNNQVTLTYTSNGQNKSFVGTLASDGQSIYFANNPIVSTIKTFKK